MVVGKGTLIRKLGGLLVRWRARTKESLRYREEIKQCRRCMKLWQDSMKHYQKMLKKNPESTEEYQKAIKLDQEQINRLQEELNKLQSKLQHRTNSKK